MASAPCGGRASWCRSAARRAGTAPAAARPSSATIARSRVISAKNRDCPACSESCTRSVAPIASGEMRSRRARTGAPASASTALMPTVLSSVLLPDMFDPLTSSSACAAPRPHEFGTARAAGMSGCARAFALEDAARVVDDLRERVVRVLVGVAAERASASSSPIAVEPRREVRARDATPRSIAKATCAPHSSGGRDRREQLVLPRVQQVDQPLQLRDALRRGLAVVRASRARSATRPRRRERLALEAREHVGEQREVVRRLLDAAMTSRHLRRVSERERELHGEPTSANQPPRSGQSPTPSAASAASARTEGRRRCAATPR